MKKQKKRKTAQKQRAKRGQIHSNVIKMPVRKRRTGELGIFERDYPPAAERRKTVADIRSKPNTDRGPDEWWMLGEYLVYDGLMDEDDSLVNEGIQALTQGANHPTPSPACMLDLAWVLMHRNLDGMALPYLQRAVDLAPGSRDAWSLKALCHIGNSQREEAIASIKQALSLQSATEGDRTLLKDLQAGKDLQEIRRAVILRKMGPDLLGFGRYSPQEEAKVTCHIVAPMLASDPENEQLLYAVAHSRYVLAQYDKARPFLRQLIELKGGHAPAYTLLGLIAKKENEDREEERRQYENALSTDPDFLLALVNLSYLLQDDGDFHAARPLLLRALEGDKTNPNYAIALDLYGSNVGFIDDDFEQEAILHERAAKLDPHRPLFKANQIISLISAGKAKDARAVFQRFKQELRTVPNFDRLNVFVEAYTRELNHPYEYMRLIDACSGALGWKATAPLVKKAWAIRHRVALEEKLDFYGSIATFAHHSGLGELSLEAWEEGSELEGGEGFRLNIAVELADLGRQAEALEIAEREPKVQPRSWTVLGNIRMNNALFGSAIEAYRNAIQADEKFLLPYSNAIDCAYKLRAPWELDDFVEKLRQDWGDDLGAQLLLAQSLLMQGKSEQASEIFLASLSEDERFLSPDEVHERISDPEDLTVFSNPSNDHHYLATQALLRSGNIQACTALLSAINQWPKWHNGDWSVLQAELLRQNGQYDDAISALEHMRDQPPPHLTRALCYLDQGDITAARKSVNLALNDPKADGYNHPEGRPDAVAEAIFALCDGNDLDFESSERHAKEAIVRDPGCLLARVAMAQTLRQQGREDEAAEVLEEASRRLPGNPEIVSLLVDVLISQGFVDKAADVLNGQRELLAENTAEIVGYRLGEIIAIAKFENSNHDAPSSASEDWPWLSALEETYQRWLTAAHISFQKADDLRSAAVLYIGKVTEKALVDKVMKPFLAETRNASDLISDQYKDISRFLEGGRAPSIGGVVRLLKSAERPFRSSEENVVTVFRNFLKNQEQSSSLRLRNPSLINGLETLARLRNDAAHTEEPDADEIKQAIELVVKSNKPGIVLTSLGVIRNK
jgi:tetratricopeptide (TPR) repeat protein